MNLRTYITVYLCIYFLKMEKIYIKMILIWILTAFVLVKEAQAATLSSNSQNITQCGNLTCYNKARCANVTNGTPDECICQRGYIGDSCKDDVDECHGKAPCFHRGKCHNIYGYYRCECHEGWTGEEDHCNIKVNTTTVRKCDEGWGGEWCQDECLNDTMCGPHKVCQLLNTGIISTTGHRCRCAPGWMGIHCTYDKNECAVPPNPCPKDRSCLNTPGSYLCICLPGWKGNNCSTDIDECLANTCQHATNCTNTAGSYNCTCEKGWTGANCTDDIDECSQNPCKNRQTCNNTLGSYECHCNAGWNGTDCDVDIDECKSSSPPCLNAGTCLNTNGSYYCKCSSGWTGRNCNNDVDECMSSPCSVRQTCNNTLGSYECHCKRGWNGSKCDVDINECLASPCLNTGNCVNTNGSYYCNCTSGWQGDSCEDDIDECDGNPCNGTLTCTNSLGSYSCSKRQTSATVSGSTDARKTYIIVGSILGAFLLLCCIVAFVFIWKKKKRNGTRVSSLNGNEKFSSKNNQVPTSK